MADPLPRTSWSGPVDDDMVAAVLTKLPGREGPACHRTPHPDPNPNPDTGFHIHDSACTQGALVLPVSCGHTGCRSTCSQHLSGISIMASVYTEEMGTSQRGTPVRDPRSGQTLPTHSARAPATAWLKKAPEVVSLPVPTEKPCREGLNSRRISRNTKERHTLQPPQRELRLPSKCSLATCPLPPLTPQLAQK